jgi:hypothetical protein
MVRCATAIQSWKLLPYENFPNLRENLRRDMSVGLRVLVSVIKPFISEQVNGKQWS